MCALGQRTNLLLAQRPSSLFAIGIMIGALAWTPVSAQCLPGINCNFSINGKKGRFLDVEITPEILAKADAATVSGVSDGRSLESVSINKGTSAGTGLNMPATEARLLAMLDKIRDAWPKTLRAPPKISVRLLGSMAYGPVAHPDNVITVPIGLLTNAKSDDEVMWVLAHEFAHIALSHFSREARQRRTKSAFEKAVACTQIALDIAQVRPQKSGQTLSFTYTEDKGIQATSLQVWSKSKLVNDFLGAFNQRLSRQQEDEADAVGYDLAFRTQNGSREGFNTALMFLKDQEARQGDLVKQFGDEMSRYISSAGAQSLAQINKGGNINDALGGLFKGIVKNAGNLAFKKLTDMVMASHRPAAKRREGMSEYARTAYRDEEDPDPSDSWLKSATADREFLEAKSTAEAVHLVRQTFAGAPCKTADQVCLQKVIDAIPTAEAALRPVLSLRYANTPLVLNTVGFLAAKQGKFDEADQAYTRAENFSLAPSRPPAPAKATPVKSPKGKTATGKAASAKTSASKQTVVTATGIAATTPTTAPDYYLQQSMDGYVEHVDMLMKRGNYSRALATISHAKTRFSDDDRFLPYLVTIALQKSNMPMLLDAVRRCGDLQDDGLTEACNRALWPLELQENVTLLSPVDYDRAMSAANLAFAKARKTSSCGLSNVEQADKDSKSSAGGLLKGLGLVNND